MVYWPKWMVVNSGGNKSASLTLLVIACIFVFIKFLFSGIVLNLGEGVVISLEPANASGLALFIAPFLALYFGRRVIEDKKAAVEDAKQTAEKQ